METNIVFHFCQGHSAYTDGLGGSVLLTPLAEEHGFLSCPSLLTDIWPPALLEPVNFRKTALFLVPLLTVSLVQMSFLTNISDNPKTKPIQY